MRDSLHTSKLIISTPARIAKGTVVLATLFASFLSLLGIITVARWFGINPAQLRDPNSVFDPRVVVTILAILLMPVSIVFFTGLGLELLPVCFTSDEETFG